MCLISFKNAQLPKYVPKAECARRKTPLVQRLLKVQRNWSKFNKSTWANCPIYGHSIAHNLCANSTSMWSFAKFFVEHLRHLHTPLFHRYMFYLFLVEELKYANERFIKTIAPHAFKADDDPFWWFPFRIYVETMAVYGHLNAQTETREYQKYHARLKDYFAQSLVFCAARHCRFWHISN